jgi:hypothetical protein
MNPIIYHLAQIAKYDNYRPQLTENERDQLLNMVTRLLQSEDLTRYIHQQQEPLYRRIINKIKETLSLG